MKHGAIYFDYSGRIVCIHCAKDTSDHTVRRIKRRDAEELLATSGSPATCMCRRTKFNYNCNKPQPNQS